MQFKLIIVFAEDSTTQAVIDAARHAGATGCTVINQARGEGVQDGEVLDFLHADDIRPQFFDLSKERLVAFFPDDITFILPHGQGADVVQPGPDIDVQDL